MKYYSLLIVLAVVAYAKAEGGKLVEAFKAGEIECAKEKNISTETLGKIQHGVFEANDNKFNCLAECLFYKVGFLKKGSKDLQVDALKKYAVEKGGDKLPGLLEHCVSKKGSDTCDGSYQVYKCYLTEINKPGSPYAPPPTAKTAAPGGSAAPAASTGKSDPTSAEA